MDKESNCRSYAYRHARFRNQVGGGREKEGGIPNSRQAECRNKSLSSKISLRPPLSPAPRAPDMLYV